MKFEVNKFLALTALLATATASAVGCSSTDAKKAPGTAGEGGDAGSAEPGAGAGATTPEAGAAGALGEAGQGGTSDGGASEGGAAGAPVEACVGEVVGQGGAADGTTTPCDIWAAAGSPDCGAEDGNLAGQGCSALYNSGAYRPSVVEAFNTCASALPDSCDQQAVIGCANGLIGRGCAEDTTTAACALVATYCPTVTNCAGVMNLLTPDGQATVADCMDPASEFYQAYTADDCDVNLKYCANLPVPAPPATP